MKTYKYKVQGVEYEVEIAEVEGKIAKVNVNGIPFEIEMQKPINAAKHPALAATKHTASAAPVAQPAPAPVPVPAGSPAGGKPAAAAAGAGTASRPHCPVPLMPSTSRWATRWA